MSSKLSALALAVAAFGAVGCSGIFVPKEQYDRDVTALKEYIQALERDNVAGRTAQATWEKHQTECGLSAESAKVYQELADALKKAINGWGGDVGEVDFDARRGVFTMGADLLFDSGKFEISAKGKEILKKFAEVNRGRALRIVGHTDSTKVAKASTKAALFTDSNMELSALRAVAVWKALRETGVSEKQMWVEGRGSNEPRGGLKTSRRVEIYLAGDAPANGKTSHK